MSDSIAVTVVGNDRPGIVAGVTQALFELGCNLEDVTSTILRGHFAMVLVVRPESGVKPEDLTDRLAAVATGLGVSVTASPLDVATLEVQPPTHMVSVYGADRPGIVYRVADRLRSRSVNITDLTSRVLGDGDHPVYALMLEVSAPATEDLEADLDDLKQQLGVEVSVRPIDPDVF